MENKPKISRMAGLDVLKALCCFGVVCIHVPFPGVWGGYVTALVRIAVPIFFMISGFFYTGEKAASGQNAQILKILKLILRANALFLVWEILRCLASGDSIGLRLGAMFSLKNLLKLIVLNESPVASHLWYLNALLYVLLIMRLLFPPGISMEKRRKMQKYLYRATPVLLVCDLAFGKYALLLWGREFPPVLVRNFLFVGLPYFTIGRMLREALQKEKPFCSAKTAAAACLLFSLTTVLERMLLLRFRLNAGRDHYISTTFLAAAVFLLFCLRYGGKKLNAPERFLAKTGESHSARIYVLHPVWIPVLSCCAEKLGIGQMYGFLAPFAVFIVSLAFSALYEKRLTGQNC